VAGRVCAGFPGLRPRYVSCPSPISSPFFRFLLVIGCVGGGGVTHFIHGVATVSPRGVTQGSNGNAEEIINKGGRLGLSLTIGFTRRGGTDIRHGDVRRERVVHRCAHPGGEVTALLCVKTAATSATFGGRYINPAWERYSIYSRLQGAAGAPAEPPGRDSERRGKGSPPAHPSRLLLVVKIISPAHLALCMRMRRATGTYVRLHPRS